MRTATEGVEDWGQLNAFLSEARQVKGATGAITRAVTGGQTKDGVVTMGPEEHTDAADEAERETPELVVCASGNLGLIYFPRLSGRVSLETLEATYPEMVDALASHPGIGLLMVRSEIARHDRRSARAACASWRPARSPAKTRSRSTAAMRPSACSGSMRWPIAATSSRSAGSMRGPARWRPSRSSSGPTADSAGCRPNR